MTIAMPKAMVMPAVPPIMRPIKTKTRVKTASKKAVFKVLDMVTLMPPVYQKINVNNLNTVSRVSTLKAFIPILTFPHKWGRNNLGFPLTKPMLSKVEAGGIKEW